MIHLTTAADTARDTLIGASPSSIHAACDRYAVALLALDQSIQQRDGVTDAHECRVCQDETTLGCLCDACRTAWTAEIAWNGGVR